jgi:hypothetical protein
MPTKLTKDHFMLSRSGKARQVVLLCHGGWEPSNGYVEIPRPMLLHFYIKHGDRSTGTGIAKAVLAAGPKAYPGMITDFTPTPAPTNASALEKLNWDAQMEKNVASFHARGEGRIAVVESMGGSIKKFSVCNYSLSLVDESGTVRLQDQILFDQHLRGNFDPDVDFMMFEKSFTSGTSSLKKAFKTARILNAGKDYAVFHYAPCRWVRPGDEGVELPKYDGV